MELPTNPINEHVIADDQPPQSISYKSSTSYGYMFKDMFQLVDETFDEFLTKIQSQSKNCLLGDPFDSLLIYKIIVGIRNDTARQQLIASDKNLSLSKTIEVCRKSEQDLERMHRNELDSIFVATAETKNAKTILTIKRKYSTHPNEIPAKISAIPIYFDGSVPELQKINEDSLRNIFAYLNLMDVVNISHTCRRFRNFAHRDLFRRNAIKIRIDILEQKIYLTAPLINTHKSELTLSSMEASFLLFGHFVKDLTIHIQYKASANEQAIIVRSLLSVIGLCKNLKILRFHSWNLTYDETDNLQDQIEKSDHLKELDISNSVGITRHWRAASTARISKLEKLTVSANEAVSNKFLDYFTNLSSLTIIFKRTTFWRMADLPRILDNNKHSLQHLNLIYQSDVNGYAHIGRLLTAKLLNLKSLEMEFNLTIQTQYMTEMPHLKSLKIRCTTANVNINSVLRTLSSNGVIESLSITDGHFCDELRPLTFDKLQSLALHRIAKASSLLKKLIRSQLPVIQHFEIDLRELSDLRELRIFYESKRTIKSIRVSVSRMGDACIPYDFFSLIIRALKEPSMPGTPRRPFLNLYFCYLHLGDKQVR